MKTNVPIELDDSQLSRLADLIDGKPTKRAATRKEIVSLCQQHIAGLAGTTIEPFATATHIIPAKVPATSDLYKVDPRDRPMMSQPDNPGYVRGWNMAKRATA